MTTGRFPMPAPSFTFAHTGERLPFFRRHQLRLRFDLHRLKLYDTATREEPWGTGLSRTRFQEIAIAAPAAARFAYQNVGHLVILPLGHRVFGIDPVGHRVLWEKSLCGRAEPREVTVRQVTADPRDDGIRVRYAGGWVQWLGSPLALGPSALCVVTRDGLEALDPLTGDTLWRRADVAPASRPFGDGRLVYVVAADADGKPTATRAFHTTDGSAADVSDFATDFRDRLGVRDGGILLSEVEKDGGVVLRRYDIRSADNAWHHTYPAKSIVARPQDTPLGGVVEPKGTVRILDSDTGDEVFRSAVRPEHLEGVTSAVVLADERSVYLLLNRPVSWYVQSRGGLHSNLTPGSGLRAVPVNGWVFAFDRATGKVRWIVPKENQMLVVNQFASLPVLLFTSRYRELRFGDVKHRAAANVPVVAVDKRTGKMLFEMNRPDLPPFYALDVAPDGRQVTFTSPSLRVRLRPEDADPKIRK